jgi:hypothetical protein
VGSQSNPALVTRVPIRKVWLLDAIKTVALVFSLTQRAWHVGDAYTNGWEVEAKTSGTQRREDAKKTSRKITGTRGRRPFQCTRAPPAPCVAEGRASVGLRGPGGEWRRGLCGGPHRSSGHVEFWQGALEVSDAGSRDARADHQEMIQVAKTLQMRQAGVGDLHRREIELG